MDRMRDDAGWMAKQVYLWRRRLPAQRGGDGRGGTYIEDADATSSMQKVV